MSNVSPAGAVKKRLKITFASLPPAGASLQLVPIISRASSSIINLQYSIIPQKNNLPSSAMQKRQNLIGRARSR